MIHPVLGAGKAVVYVLPETRPLHEVFAIDPLGVRPLAVAARRSGAPAAGARE